MTEGNWICRIAFPSHAMLCKPGKMTSMYPKAARNEGAASAHVSEARQRGGGRRNIPADAESSLQYVSHGANKYHLLSSLTVSSLI